MKVLIADDEYYARTALLKVVNEWDGEVEIVGCVESGEDAIRIIKNTPPTLLLADVRMPGIDGIELCQYVKKHAPKVNVFIISGYADFGYAQQAISLNVKKYLLKPVNTASLYLAMDELLKELTTANNNDGNIVELNSEATIIENLQQIIRSDYQLSLTLNDIARKRLYLNASYLSRLTKQKTGKNFSELLLDVRMEKARELLRNDKGLSVSTIATMVGYNKASQLIEQYKRHFGVTPGVDRGQ